MKKLTLIFTIAMAISFVHAQVIINEIMYNPPESGTDSLEYIELYNNGASAVDMSGYSFDQGIVFTFPTFTLMPDDYVVVCVDSAVLARTLGVNEAFEWTSGGLSNGGEDIILIDAQSNVVDIVDYENGGDWPSDANGEGASLELCDPDRDNNSGANWKASINNKGIVINGREVRASPDAINGVSCADHTIDVKNNFFSPDTITINVGEMIEWDCTEGRHNVNGSTATFPSNPVSFMSGAPRSAPWTFSYTFDIPGVYDYRCDPHFLLGMTGYIIVEDNNVPPLVITEIMYNDPGLDSLEFIELFNASDVEINLDGYRMINAFTHLFTNVTIPEQSYLVLAKYSDKFEAAFGTQALQWDDGTLNNSGEAIEIIDNQGRSIDRVVYDTDSPWDSRANGGGRSLILCDVLADNSDPANWSVSNFDAEFEINNTTVYANPGASDECEEVQESYPLYSIGEVTTVDAGGLPDSLGVKCALQGVVHGVDLQGGNSIQFTIIDQTGGISLFSSNNFNYTVNEGDELLVKGTIVQFSGLSQITPDSLRIVSTGNATVTPRVTTVLDESTESELVTLQNLSFVDPNDWDDSGSSFNIDVTNGSNTFSIRIDSDVNVAGTSKPGEPFHLTGLGGQFDSNEPFTEGYQLLPRYVEDIDEISSTYNSDLEKTLIYPNPVYDRLQITTLLEDITLTILDLTGKSIISNKGKEINVKGLTSGMYFLELQYEGSRRMAKIFKK
jgi:plastocyanin